MVYNTGHAEGAVLPVKADFGMKNYLICYRAFILFLLFKTSKAFLLGRGSQVDKFSFLNYCYNYVLLS